MIAARKLRKSPLGASDEVKSSIACHQTSTYAVSSAVSAMSRSFKLTWDAERQLFALNEESLPDLLTRLCNDFLVS